MKTQVIAAALLAHLVVLSPPAAAQQASPGGMAEAFVDPQNGLSLEDAVRQAIQLEPTLRAARTDVVAAKGRRLQATLRPNPSVSVERREEPTGTDSLTMMQVQWPLDLFRRPARVTVADREIDVTERSVDDRIRLLASDVRARYGDAAAAVRELTWADRAVALVSRQFALVRQRAEAGAVPSLERDQMEVELHRYEADRLLSLGRTEAAMVDLKRAIGLQTTESVQLRDTLDDLVLPAVQQPRAVDPQRSGPDPIEQRADIRAADAQVRLAEARVAHAASDGRFDVSLFGSYMRMDAGFPQNGLGDNGHVERIRGVFHDVSAGAIVTVPLRNRNQGEVAAVRAEQAGAHARLDAARLAAQAELASAEARVAASRAALAITDSTVRLSARNLDVVRQAYELGRSTMTDVLAEQRRYLEVERTQIATMKATYDAQVALMLATGER